MARKRQFRRIISIIVFILVVALSGYALSASGNLQNPLNAVTQMTQLLSGSSAQNGAFGGGAPPAGVERGTPPGGETSGGRGSEASSGLQWSRIGEVLYSAWVIAAVSALVMVVGPMIGWSIKQFQRGIKRLTPARAPALHKARA